MATPRILTSPGSASRSVSPKLTDLTDKDGKELYEGDIIFDMELVFYHGKYMMRQAESAVKKSRLKSEYMMLGGWYNHKHATLQGNIHEHPERLEA